GDQLRFAATPLSVQTIDLFFAFQIQPCQHWTSVAVLLSIVGVRQEDSAVSFGNSCKSKFLTNPIHGESETAFIVSRRLIDISYGYLRNGARKLRCHCDTSFGVSGESSRVCSLPTLRDDPRRFSSR